MFLLASLCVLVSVASWLPAAAPAPVAAVFEGRWEGAIVMRMAESEVDLVVDLESQGEAGLTGELDLPLGGVSDQPLLDVKVEGETLTFEYRDDTGSSYFDGRLSPDGREIRGEMKEGARSYDFYLTRQPETPRPGAGVLDLSPDDLELRTQFNEDQGAVRVVLLVSPTCTHCLALARLVQRYVLGGIDDDRLRLYVVWLPVLESDSRGAAEGAAGNLQDPRVTQFWALDAGLGRAYHDLVTPEGMAVAYDLLFVYDAGTRWPQEGLPEASSYMHQLGEKLPAENGFNGLRLTETIRGMLASGP